MRREPAEVDQVIKAAAKEAFREFLEEKWTQATSSLGKWFLSVVAAAVVAGLVYLILWSNGWRPPQ